MDKKRPFLNIVLIITFLLIIITAFGAFQYYKRIYINNINLKSKESFSLYIPSNADFVNVKDSLSKYKILINEANFVWLANLKKYKSKVKPGRYIIKAGMSNNELINMLRSGRQKPVKLTFNNIRTKEQLAGKVSKYLEFDSLSLINLLNDNRFLKAYGFNKLIVISMFIPNTYEFYWNTSAKAFFNKLNRAYKKFWNDERLTKAKKIGMTKLQVSTLASIVQAEQSVHKDEKEKVAGLYINRLNNGMLLQSDPTVVYAIGDFSIRRVLNSDKEIDSPFNTYKNVGLPPAPINLPEISSIDAVLNYQHHNYLYMCAKEDFSGYHNFSKNIAEHNLNARKYQRALNKKRIWR